MEDKLLRFRKEKAKQKFKQDIKDRCKHLGSRLYEGVEGFCRILYREGMADNDHHVDLDEDEKSISEEGSLSEEGSISDEQLPCNYLLYFTIFITWVSVYIFFIYIEFGAVYFCVTGLLFIYFNTRTGKRFRHEISAYSVFNRNCETIDGTFTAEQFDKQIRSGML